MKHQNKNISGRLAAAVMAGAMMVSMVGMNAFAAPVTAGSESFTITKNLTKDANDMTPNVSFTFSVTKATAGTDEVRNGIPVSDGIEGGVTVDAENASADFAPGTALDTSTSLSDTVGFDVNLNSFTTPGIYKYTVAEVQGSYDGITYSTNVLNLYVYIQNGTNGLKVAYTELVDPDGGEGGKEIKTDSFTNTYGSLNDLVLYKVISGNSANMSDEFTFSVKIDGEDGEKYYVEFGSYETGSFAKNAKDPIVLTSGTAQDVTLGHNDAIKIYGLDNDDRYTIEEKDDNTNGYTLEIDDVADDDGITNGVISADKVIKYENNKEAATPTGIAMTVAPYIIMVAAAAGVAVLFLRRRNNEF